MTLQIIPKPIENENLQKINGTTVDVGVGASSPGTQRVVLSSDQTTVPVSATALPLPAGAATSANQTTGNASLASIDTKTPTVGQKTSANSSPVVIASDQSSIPVTLASTTANQGTPNTIANSWPVEITDGTNILGTPTHPVRVDPTGTTTQPVSGTVTITPSGTQDVNVKQIGATTVLTGTGATGAGSQRVTVAVDSATVAGSASLPAGTNTIGKVDQGVGGASAWAISAASLPLPSGAATAANQTNVQSAPGTPQTTAITIQGNASGVAVPISAASLPLPSGAATSALQTTGNTSLSSIDTKTPTVGQKTSANSSPVVIASDQSAVPISAASLPLPTGAATSALQTTGNTSLSSIDTKTPALGQTTSAGSTPVVIASDQSPVAFKSLVTISTVNSSTTPLTAGSTFTGPWELTGNNVSISVLCNTDSLAASGCLKFDFSTDGTNIDRTVPVDIATGGDYAATGNQAKYFRVRLTAGAANQTYLRLQTQYLATAEGLKATPLQDTLTGSSTALVTRGAIIGLSTAGGGTYVTAKVTPSGALATAPGGGSTTATETNQAASATSVTLLAANTSRLGATIYNDDTLTTGTSIYVRLSATAASTTAFTVKLVPGAYYEVPYGYTGAITAIWSSALTGTARITELT